MQNIIIFLLTLVVYTVGVVLITRDNHADKCDAIWTIGFILTALTSVVLGFMICQI